MASRREKHGFYRIRSPSIKTQRDKRKLLVVSYLISLGINPETKSQVRATKNQIMNKAFQLRKQEPGDFKQLMNELVAMDWIDSQTRDDGYEWYTFTENGKNALNEAKRLVEENHPLAALEIFEDVEDF